jgi:hypothetical protein
MTFTERASLGGVRGTLARRDAVDALAAMMLQKTYL